MLQSHHLLYSVRITQQTAHIQTANPNFSVETKSLSMAVEKTNYHSSFGWIIHELCMKIFGTAEIGTSGGKQRKSIKNQIYTIGNV